MTEPASPAVVTVQGHAHGDFAEVADAFARSIARQGRGGAGLAVHVDGELVVDLVGGEVGPGSLVQVFSVSKALVAVAAAHAVSAGRLDIDRPLADFWPAFDRAATAAITTRMILSHTSGISAISRPLSLDELLSGGLDEAVATEDPLWTPGTRLGYGAFTFGALVDGVFRNALGTTVAQYVDEHLTTPVSAEFWFGAPQSELARVAPLRFTPSALTPAEANAQESGAAIPDGSFAAVAADPPAFFTDPRVIGAGWPSMSGVSSARALSRVFAATVGPVDGVRLLDDSVVANITLEHSGGTDALMHHGTRFGLGVELPHAQFPLLGAGSFGHEGAGGSAVAIDPARRVSIAYVTTAFPATLGASDGALTLINSLRFCLDAR
ncbi:serine hydrolase domain-containing protein [uncultured Microbacterium sp.]|uniref:serine hydrolase domain-containing protein n=1 Tax=uncultured Microbacterium sp. TaxID=191216 RepID=UPI0035CBDAC4